MSNLIYKNEKGFVLPVGLMFMAVIAVLGTTAVIVTTTDLKIGGNYRDSVQAFCSAEAGIEEARARLMGSSTAASYAGDPSAAYDPWWSAYILTSSSWQPSDDPDYNANYNNYIPTLVSHTNTTVAANSLQAAISYFVKIRHKREYDAEQAGHTTSLPIYFDGDGNTGTHTASTLGNIIYYGYRPSSTILEQFTTTVANPPNASPVQIITSHGMRGGSLKIIEIESSRQFGPPIVAALYGDSVGGNGTVSVVGDDNCAAAAPSVPAVAYATSDTLSGSGNVTLTSSAGPTLQLPAPLNIAQHVTNLASQATVILTADQVGYNVGSSSNYEIVYCDATLLSPDSQLNLRNLTGYGTLVVRGDLYFSGNLTWYGLIIASGDVAFYGGGSDTKNVTGAVLANTMATLQGKINITYDSCEVDNARNNYSQTTLIWKESLN